MLPSPFMITLIPIMYYRIILGNHFQISAKKTILMNNYYNRLGLGK